MAKSDHSYIPRTGTKVAVALTLIEKQPRTARELCTLLSCTCSAVRSMLIRPLSHGVIIKTEDKEGRVFFAVPNAACTQSAAKVNDCTSKQRHPKNIRLAPNQAPHHKTVVQQTKTTPRRENGRSQERKTPAAGIASHTSNGELTIAANGKSIKLNASQRQQLYSYLQKIHGTR